MATNVSTRRRGGSHIALPISIGHIALLVAEMVGIYVYYRFQGGDLRLLAAIVLSVTLIAPFFMEAVQAVLNAKSALRSGSRSVLVSENLYRGSWWTSILAVIISQATKRAVECGDTKVLPGFSGVGGNVRKYILR